MKQNLYFLAIVLSEPVQSEITQFKFYLQRKYGWKVALKSPAHITLIPPFHLNVSEEENLLQHLPLFLIDFKELKIELNGFNHFDKRTIFVSVNQNLLLNELYQALNNHFQHNDILKKSIKETDQHKPFYPHITIANRDIEEIYFEDAWNYFKDKVYSVQTNETKFSLLKHDGSNWKVIKDFSF